MFKVYLLHDFITRIFLALKDFFFLLNQAQMKHCIWNFFFPPYHTLNHHKELHKFPVVNQRARTDLLYRQHARWGPGAWRSPEHSCGAGSEGCPCSNKAMLSQWVCIYLAELCMWLQQPARAPAAR